MTADQMLTDSEHAELADRLYRAIRTGEGIDPPSESIEYGFGDAYRIRRKLVDRLIADGGRPRGHKIGFTSEAMQKMYGMTGPDFGQLLDNMFVPHGTPIDVSSLSDTRVEPEIAFELAEPLTGPGVTVDRVISATSAIRAAVEVIDSRVGAMRAKAVDSVSDNAGAGRVVLGTVVLDSNAVSLEEIPVEIEVDGERLSGRSGDVMGHPAAPLAWLANKLAEIDGLGGTLNAGDVVITGSSTKSMAVQAGSSLCATFGPLGRIDIVFT